MANPPEDEWFPSTDTGLASGGRPQDVPDEWLVPAAPPARTRTADPWALVDERLLVLAALAVVFVVALLAAFGAFGDGGTGRVPLVIATTAPPAASLPVTHTTPATTTTAHRTSTAPTTTLKPGDTGPQVKALQTELAGLGYSVGKIDGIYGKSATAAVTAFQRAHHLTADGIVGSATLQALSP